jgi:hypothetical protein
MGGNKTEDGNAPQNMRHRYLSVWSSANMQGKPNFGSACNKILKVMEKRLWNL